MAEVDARKAIDSFFHAFNAKDGEALQKSMHFPHMRISGQGRMSVTMDSFESMRISEMAFRRLTEVEEWDHSSLDVVEVIHASDVKVHFKIEFSRYKANGTKYAVHKSLWIVTKRNGRWGILARSSYAP